MNRAAKLAAAIAKIAAIAALAKEFGALTCLDEVHAVGLYGAQGGGLAQQQGCAHAIDLIQGTLGKAYGVIGGYIATSAALVTTRCSLSPKASSVSRPTARSTSTRSKPRLEADAGGGCRRSPVIHRTPVRHRARPVSPELLG